MRLANLSVAISALAAVFASSATRAGAQPTATTVTCKDSTKAISGLGACSHHGGVMPKAPNKKVRHLVAKTPPPPLHKTPVPSGPGKVTPTAAETSPIRKTPPESTAAKPAKKIP